MFSPISAKRQRSCLTSNSPQKTSNSTDYKKIVYVTEEEKDVIPFETLPQSEKIFVLLCNGGNFTQAECVSVYPQYHLSNIGELGKVEGNKIYLDFEKFDGVSVDSSAPILRFNKIYVNLRSSKLLGGFRAFLKCLAWPETETLEIDFSESEVTFNEVSEFLDFFQNRNMKYFGLIWQSYLMSSEQHSIIIEKLAKINLKKLVLIMNENYIKYEKQSRWILPKNLETLYL